MPRNRDNPLITRLRHLTGLSENALGLIAAACTPTHDIPARADIVREGCGTDHIHVVLEGWCCRYRLLPDGSRQIPALLIPGDICDIDAFMLRRTHFGVAALTRSTVASLSRDHLRTLLDQNPEIRDVFWWLISVENSIAAEWTVGLGRRSAEERLAHLLCELLVRLQTVDMAAGNTFAFPLTQEELGDALGLSTVHVNRTLQTMRSRGAIRFEGRNLVVCNWEALKNLGGFSADYLHMEGLRPSELDLSVA